jgi:hypothetical protein
VDRHGCLPDRNASIPRSGTIPLIREGSSTARRSGGPGGFGARSCCIPAVLVLAGPVAAPSGGRPTARRGCGPARWAGSGETRRHAGLVAARVGPDAAVVAAWQRRIAAPGHRRGAPRARWPVPRAATGAATAWRPARQLPPDTRHQWRWSSPGLWDRPPRTTGGPTSRSAPQQPASPTGLAVMRRGTRVGSVPAGPPTCRGRRGGVPAAGACAVAGPRPGRRQPTARRWRRRRRRAVTAAQGTRGGSDRDPG